MPPGGGVRSGMRWVIFLLVLAGGPPQAATLQGQTVQGQTVFSDGFEAPALSATLNITGAFSFGPWSGQAPTSGGNAGVVRDPWALAGAQAFVFNGNNPPLGSWIETSFATTPGASYRLAFSLGRGGAVGQLLQARVIVFDGAGPATWLDEVAVPAQVSGWTGFDYGFTAAGTSPRVRWVDYSGANQVSDLWLDGVSVTLTAAAPAVPEAGDWAAYAGFAVLGIAARRHRRRRILDRMIRKVLDRIYRIVGPALAPGREPRGRSAASGDPTGARYAASGDPTVF